MSVCASEVITLVGFSLNCSLLKSYEVISADALTKNADRSAADMLLTTVHFQGLKHSCLRKQQPIGFSHFKVLVCCVREMVTIVKVLVFRYTLQ